MGDVPSIVTVRDGMDRRKSLIFVVAVVASMVCFSAVVTSVVQVSPSDEYDARRLSTINFTSPGYKLIEKKSRLGRELVGRAYGPYRDAVLEEDFDLSVSAPVEFSIPTFLVDGIFYGMRESLSLRYRLWRTQAPQVVLLGSSMLFMNFNRGQFFALHPDVRLIDFTVGNNIPPLTDRLLAKLDEFDLNIAPRTLFIYGMKAHEFDKSRAFGIGIAREEAIDRLGELKDSPQQTMTNGVNQSLRFGVLRKRLFEGFGSLSELLRRKVVPHRDLDKEGGGRQIPKEWANDPVGLRRYLLTFPQSYPDDGSPPEPFQQDRIASVESIANRIHSAGGSLVIVKLPDSSLSKHRMEGLYKNYNAGIGPLAQRVDADLIDLSDHKDLGIDDRHYIWPNRMFDQNHLNAEGSAIFTRRLSREVIAPHLRSLSDSGKRSDRGRLIE